ncbi:MAG: peptidoglycan-associated lipoprotein Pal [Burkholderiales bacterium]|jgi:peptidoglycan-associated lipoprotein|nr:peptidoglycan-associated lipoprotein Pal [Burkholderiales bacterium]
MFRTFVTLTAALLLAACSSVPLDEQKGVPIDDKSKPAAGATTDPAAQTGAVKTVDATGSSTRGDDPTTGLLARRSIYFEFDQFTVQEQYKPLLEAHAKYLGANRARRIAIEGNTDERGSREYNLALGQKRAEAVKRALLLLGVTEVQVETVSFGEEKPRAQGSTEEALAENRRADIVYK